MSKQKKVFVKDLSVEVLSKVLDTNGKLQQEVYEDYEESQMYHVEELLSLIKPALSNWSIGFYGHNYITIKCRSEFLEIVSHEKDYYLLSDEQREEAQKVFDKLEELQELEFDLNDLEKEIYVEEDEDQQVELQDKFKALEEQYNLLDKEIDQETSIIENYVVEAFNQITSVSTEDINSYFKEFYVDSRLSEDCYILEGDENYIMYEDISYTKSYK